MFVLCFEHVDMGSVSEVDEANGSLTQSNPWTNDYQPDSQVPWPGRKFRLNFMGQCPLKPLITSQFILPSENVL